MRPSAVNRLNPTLYRSTSAAANVPHCRNAVGRRCSAIATLPRSLDAARRGLVSVASLLPRSLDAARRGLASVASILSRSLDASPALNPSNGRHRTYAALAVAAFVTLCLAPPTQAARQETLVVVGAPGNETYAERFTEAATLWRDAAVQAGSDFEVIGLDASTIDDRERIQNWLASRPIDSPRPLWLVYLGHGSYNAEETLLNLRGPDLAAKDLASWLEPFQRQVIVVHGGSASAPLIPLLSGPNRIIITATRSGEEVNYARFGESFAAVLAKDQTDINQDGQNAILEVFLTAARQVERFYLEAGRLATEHALIDDNGDGVGTPFDWFRGTRATKTAASDRQPDGFESMRTAYIPSDFEQTLTASQLQQRAALEAKVESLRQAKETMPEELYYQELEAIFLQLAEIYRDSLDQ